MLLRILPTLFLLGMMITPAVANGCSQGEVFDTTLDRCVLAQSTVEQKTQTNACAELTGEAYDKCFEENVNQGMAQAQASGDVESAQDPKSSYIVPGVITLGAAYVLFDKKDMLGECGSTSMWLMLGGGVTSLMGEFLAQRSYKKKLRNLTDDYKGRIENTDVKENATTARLNMNQTVAFDFQIEQEKARQKAHKARKTTYNIAFGLYSASAVAAIVEGFTVAKNKPCGFGSGGLDSTTMYVTPGENLLALNSELFGDYYYVDKMKKSEFLEVIQRKVFNVFGEAAIAQEGGQSHQEGQGGFDGGEEMMPTIELDEVVVTATRLPKKGATGGGELAAGGVDGAIPKDVLEKNANKGGAKDMIKKATRSPWVRAAIGGLLAFYSKKVANKAGKLADISGRRVEMLAQLRDDFLATGGSGFEQCSQADRKSPSKPFCFCYSARGKKDESKKDNAVCAAVFGGADFNYMAGLYGKDGGESSQGIKGCMRRNGRLDPSCNCRKEKDQSSGKGCTNISGTLTLGNLSSLGGLPNMVNDTAKFTNGRISTGQLGSGNDVRNLVKNIDKNKEKMMKNPKMAPTLKKIDALQNKLQRQVAGLVNQGLNNGSIQSPFGGSGLEGGSQATDPKEIMNDVSQEVNKIENQFKKSLARKGGKRGGNFDFDLGGAGDSSIEIESDVAEVMKKDFNYNAINDNPDNDIFKIISVRYQRSGFRRLFDEEGISQADDASEIRIHGQ